MGNGAQNMTFKLFAVTFYEASQLPWWSLTDPRDIAALSQGA